MAWSDVQGTVLLGVTVMLLGGITWLVGCDTIYDYVYVVGDTRLKLSSTANLFGERGREWLGGFNLATVILWSIGGLLLSMSTPYFVGMLMLAVHLGWQAWRIDFYRSELELKIIRANIWTGLILVFSCLAGTTTLF